MDGSENVLNEGRTVLDDIYTQPVASSQRDRADALAVSRYASRCCCRRAIRRRSRPVALRVWAMPHTYGRNMKLLVRKCRSRAS